MYAHIRDLAEFAASGGALVALSFVCLVQYAVHVARLRAVRRGMEAAREERDERLRQVRYLEEEWLVIQLENEFLREFVAQTDLQRGIDVLLRRFVPHPEDHFVALLLYEAGSLRPYRARGLCDASQSALRVPPDLEARVMDEEVVRLEGHELIASSLLPALSSRERGRAREVVLLRVGEPSTPVGMVLTTTLFPANVGPEQQLALCRRVMQSVAGNITWARMLESREDRLRSTTEMLELRAITDRGHTSPLAMLEQFVDALRRMVTADRVSLYLATGDGPTSGRAVARAGVSLGPGIDATWRDHERRLAEYLFRGASDAAPLVPVDRKTLLDVGVQSLVSEAVLAPVPRDGARVGAVCFTSRRATFDHARGPLVEWACRHLGETLDRVLLQASAERRARQDALTELANRGEFDARMGAELHRAVAAGTEISLLLIDLDHFKRVNDEYGHLAGDEVLRCTARTLRQSVSRIRSTDRALVARYGGEEIAVLLPGMGTCGAKRIAEDLRSQIEDQVIPYDEHELRVTASLGVATCPECGTDADDLIAAADAALYRAKELGRNRVVSATPVAVG